MISQIVVKQRDFSSRWQTSKINTRIRAMEPRMGKYPRDLHQTPLSTILGRLAMLPSLPVRDIPWARIVRMEYDVSLNTSHNLMSNSWLDKCG
jgi:hypothetical protein